MFFSKLLCKPGSFSLNHTNPNTFDTSQWDRSELKVSTWYMVYRMVMAVLFVSVISAFGAGAAPNIGDKFFIYMTNQGVMLLTVSYVISAALVFTRWCYELCNKDKVYHTKCRINVFYKISWILSTCFFDVALFITLVFWIALYPYVVKYGMLKTSLDVAVNFFIHGFNSISCIVDIFIVRRDIKFWHLWYAIAYGLSYMVFSLIYWAAGGTGACRTDEKTSEKTCDPYIYPILDWDGKPGIAVATIAIGLVILPLIHLFWMACTKIRVTIYRCTAGKKVAAMASNSVDLQETA